ncbi:aldehyde dehydrogenase family protein [Ramlibacter sp. WS9]|uniref:aldehyde dehydrogenase family protein n=1 Tax=Ramlibacter sp. WS9 TaxID=1882741 RepID=UPI001142E3F9|nr:aldehyde dehydrogenase family protein [Ramlibacter sp. WS9]ROZ75080.1 aldehyde dehydrogenase family protein [Ramlibacter sp. WS9]
MTQTATSRNLIGGAWADGGTAVESLSPSTGRSIGQFMSAGAGEAAAAIAAARTAFDSTSWSQDARARARALNELADRLAERVDEVAASLSREGGKLLWQTGWEIALSVEWLRYAAATAVTQAAGDHAEVAPGITFSSTPEPLGVAGIISPWNSPIILTVRALGPALAAGCTVVAKLPGQTGLTNGLFAEVVAATKSLPAGVVNILTESGNAVAPALVESPHVDVISYTGSTHVGRAIAASGAKTLKRLNLELGGKTPLVVFADANLDVVVPTIVTALTMMNGQFCVTGSRVLVQRSIADRLRAMLIEAVGSVKVGPSDDPASQIGPLIDAASARRVNQIVEEAAAYGKVLVRGGLVEDAARPGGAYYQPSVVEVDRLDVPLVQEEVFGPVQTFEIFDDEADAIRMANGTDFGLGAAVFTQDELRARRVSQAIKAGTVWTNCWGVLSERFEQGAFKQSGYGYLCGPRGIETFQNMRVYAHAAPMQG